VRSFAHRCDRRLSQLVRLDVTNPCDTAQIGTLSYPNGYFLIKVSPGVAMSLPRGDLNKVGVPVDDFGGVGWVHDFGQPVDLVLTG
jgi:hypothetical protein